MNRWSIAWVVRALLLSLCLWSGYGFAEPYLAVQSGLKCTQCHVNPTGGGLRGPYGDVFAQTLMPATHLDTGTDTWTGNVTGFLRVGGDLRTEALATEVPHVRRPFRSSSSNRCGPTSRRR